MNCDFIRISTKSRNNTAAWGGMRAAGFAAVENMYTTQQSMGCVLAEQWPVRFACTRKPEWVPCNGVDVTHLLTEESCRPHQGTYTVSLNPGKGKAILEVLWNCQ